MEQKVLDLYIDSQRRLIINDYTALINDLGSGIIYKLEKINNKGKVYKITFILSKYNDNSYFIRSIDYRINHKNPALDNKNYFISESQIIDFFRDFNNLEFETGAVNVEFSFVLIDKDKSY